ncbi:hypothetical protein ACA910_008343 [Epithemia clementina (nom. ined.)]
MPDADALNNMIAVLWDDFDLSSSGNVHYQLNYGASFTVQWNKILGWVEGSSNTFQAILLKGTNCVELSYESFDTIDYVSCIKDLSGF